MNINQSQTEKFIRVYDTELKNTVFPMVTSLKLAKIYSECKLYLDAYSEQFQKILSTHAQKDENGRMKIDENDASKILIKPEERELAEKELNDLYAFRWTINEDALIELNDLPSTNTTPDIMFALLPFIKIAQN